jgi:hypothetical protein
LHTHSALLHTLPSPTARTVSPVDFGGDPTGKLDATAAVLAAVSTCVNASTIIPGVFPVAARDAGGCTVDLEGGEFLISQSIVIPS